MSSADSGDDDRPRPSKRPRSTLFLPDSDSDNDNTQSQQQQQQPDISAIFADAENDESLTYTPLAPPLDLDALRREADARHSRNVQPMVLTPHPIMPSSSPPRDAPENPTTTNTRGTAKPSAGDTAEGKKERRKPAKLDESSLLGPNGLPLLIKQTKNFQPKGKGHEESDLNRLLQVYQFWTHRLYPKTQFRDTVERVEKLCHSKRMHVSLSVWRDEARGIINGRATNNTSDDDEDPGDPSSNSNVHPLSSSPSQPSASSASHTDDTSPDPSQNPPSSASDHISDDDNFDIDTFIRDEGDQAVVPAASGVPSPKAMHTYGKPREQPIDLPTVEDEAMWDELMAFDDAPPPPRPAVAVEPPTVVPIDLGDDEAMWDVVRELEKEPPVPPISNSDNIVTPMDEDDDWDDMYL